MIAGALFGARRVGRELLGVFGEVIAAVGRVEALGQDDDLGAAGGGFVYFVACVGEVGGFVGAARELDAGELDGLQEEGRCHCAEVASVREEKARSRCGSCGCYCEVGEFAESAPDGPHCCSGK